MSTLTCVLHLGTNNIRAAVAWRDELGHGQVVAVERIETTGCIRHGCVSSVDEASGHIKKLMQKLQNRLRNAASTEPSAELSQALQRVTIDRVYIGLSGMSLRTLPHDPSVQLPEDATVTAELQNRLLEESLHLPLDGVDVLEAVAAGYSIDGVPTSQPIGCPCTTLTAHHSLIVAEPRLRQGMTTAAERAGLKVAGYLTEPLALAEILKDNERRDGCVLLNVGAGTTTLMVYADGGLRHLAVIPLGSDTVTQDIMTKGVSHDEAELMKRLWGNVSSEAEASTTQETPYWSAKRRLSLGELNSVMTCRYEEILANVVHQLELAGYEPHELAGGCVLTGGGAQQKGLVALTRRRVGFGSVVVRSFTGLSYNGQEPYYAGLLAMLRLASEDCRLVVAPPQPAEASAPTPQPEPTHRPAPQPKEPTVEAAPVKPASASQPAERTDSAPGRKGRDGMRRRISGFIEDLFSGQDNESEKTTHTHS